MEKAYRLNLNMQPNGDHEVHADDCRYYPTLTYDVLGRYRDCETAVAEAKRKHPKKAINGCVHCARPCHTG
jgi:hypothetical protein